MQSAAGSLRSAGPSRAVRHQDGTIIWGIGSEGLSLSGHYKFCVLKGATTFNGITLTSSASIDNSSDNNNTLWYNVSSPVSPFPIFKSVYSGNDAHDGMVPEELASYPSVIAVKSSNHPLNVSELASKFKSLWHDLQRVEAPNQSYVQIPRSWTEIIKNDTSISRHGPHQFMVLGPKNSGKSTLARYLSNRLLSIVRSQNTGSKVYYLELDPGQPEFTPPGCLSLHLITDFNFSPAYAHSNFENAIKSHHLGYTNPIDTPDRYLEICRDLVGVHASIASSHSDFLIVNTSGVTKGMGIDLNSQLMEILNPDDTLMIHLGPSEFHVEMQEVDRVDFNGEGGQTMSTITTSGFSSTELRLLQITSYLHQYTVKHLTTLPPFELKLGVRHSGIYGIGVIDCTEICLAEDLGICVEGTLVSINVLDENATVECIDDKHPILKENEANDIWKKSSCIGLGVIQLLSDEFVRLLTPLNPISINIDNSSVVLIRGRLQLPTWELHNREFQDCPWVSTVKPQGSGASYTKFRRNIKRN